MFIGVSLLPTLYCMLVLILQRCVTCGISVLLFSHVALSASFYAILQLQNSLLRSPVCPCFTSAHMVLIHRIVHGLVVYVLLYLFSLFVSSLGLLPSVLVLYA